MLHQIDVFYYNKRFGRATQYYFVEKLTYTLNVRDGMWHLIMLPRFSVFKPGLEVLKQIDLKKKLSFPRCFVFFYLTECCGILMPHSVLIS